MGVYAWGTFRGQQVGVVEGHALLWRGDASSAVFLHPRGFERSEAHDASSGQQVGWGIPNGGRYPEGPIHGLLWRGSASNVVDLHVFPPGFAHSYAWHIDASGDIVGSASNMPWGWNDPRGPNSRSHAFLWKRNVPNPAHPGGKTPRDARMRSAPHVRWGLLDRAGARHAHHFVL